MEPPMTHPLVQALEVTDMVMIDDLYAFEFDLDEDDGLIILCMDGRHERRWRFTPKQLAGATQLVPSGEWKIDGVEGEHRLRLLDAFSAEDDEGQA
jgi:hypothetical protein